MNCRFALLLGVFFVLGVAVNAWGWHDALSDPAATVTSTLLPTTTVPSTTTVLTEPPSTEAPVTTILEPEHFIQVDTDGMARHDALPSLAPSPADEATDYGSGACGGDLPPCWVMMQESGGDIGQVYASGCGGFGCYGKWQFDPRTSEGLGYPLTMDQYPESVQDEAARSLWAGGAGCSHWNAC